MIFQITSNATHDISIVVNERNCFGISADHSGEKPKAPKITDEVVDGLVAQIEAAEDPLTEQPIGKMTSEDIALLKAGLTKPVPTDEQTAISQAAKGR